MLTFYEDHTIQDLLEQRFLNWGQETWGEVINWIQTYERMYKCKYICTYIFLEQKSVTFIRFSQGFSIKKLMFFYSYFN